MTDKRNEQIPDEENFSDDDGIIVEMTDDDGNSYFYVEEMVIPVGNDKFALLVELHDEHEHGCDCGCDCDCDDDVIIAKIVTNADGEDEYIEPTDEEFEAVQAAYEKILDEDETT
ncbi:MAG: DUF1292 domain-containing protein [Selenomonadaceae bacterium]|nr:DUF1292 domain-containing protein [Selenomonadaceae bacterium]